MAGSDRLYMAASSSSLSSDSSAASSDIFPQHKYDVFLSFRGEDTRSKFTSHLYACLKRKKIHTYMDDKSLERGDEIAPALLTAIEQSKLSIIIFSKHYARSKWCLNELVHILQCKEVYGQLVIPVFYDIDPAHVRKQERSYANAFAVLEKQFKDNMGNVLEWREALTAAANLSGFDSQNIRDDAELVERIVEVVLLKLNCSLPEDLKGLVGTESRTGQIESLLLIHAREVPLRSVGIWGPCGIGKTTLAEAIYHQYFFQFEACSFLANIREKSEKYGLDYLKNKLFHDLLKEDSLGIGTSSIESTFVKRRLSRTKVLIVLDDVSDVKQSKVLLGDPLLFGPGSRIIITTRYRSVLENIEDDEHIYEVKELNTEESIQLFQSIAFEDNSFSTEYLDLSREVVSYAQGFPLALKVLGSLFRDCNRKDSWKQELRRLRKLPSKEIKNVLRLSYNRLEYNDRGILLDIACFLKGEKKCHAERVLQLHGFDPRGIETLICTFLISVSMEGHIEIHDLVEEMGQSIVREECSPEKRSRLWNFQDVRDITGPSTVEALFLDISDSMIPRQELIRDELLRHMPLLRSLKLYVPIESYDLCGQKKRMRSGRLKRLLDVKVLKDYSTVYTSLIGGLEYLPENLKFKKLLDVKVLKETSLTLYKCLIGRLESLPETLRYLYWEGYPFRYLPSKYAPRSLVELHMPHSQLTRLLWTNGKAPRNLKIINLRDSKNLTEVPDLSHSPSIERIDLSGCSSIRNLNYSGGDNQNRIMLKELLMSWCTKLGSVPHMIHCIRCLETLDLRGCRKLRRLPHFSVGQHFCSLRRLNLSWCNMFDIPDGLICLSTLQEMALSGTMIKSIPASIKNALGLRKLLLNNCKKLQSLPELPPLLEILEADGCRSLMTVATSSSALIQDGAPDCTPREIMMFTKSLDQSCKIELLEYLEHAKDSSSDARTESDHDVPKLIQHDAPWLGERHIFTNCMKLEESSKSHIIDNAQLRIMRIASSKREYGTVFATCPGNIIPRWFKYQEEGCSMDIRFPLTTGDKFLGFALSAVFASRNQGWDYLFRLRCHCNFKTDDGEGHEFKFESPLVMNMEDNLQNPSIEQDNVWIFFQKEVFWRSPNIPLDKITAASFSFSPQYYDDDDDDDQEKEVCRVKVKRCGIQILYKL